MKTKGSSSARTANRSSSGPYYINPVTLDKPGEENNGTFHWEVLKRGRKGVQYFVEKKGEDNWNFPAVKGLVTRLNNKHQRERSRNGTSHIR